MKRLIIKLAKEYNCPVKFTKKGKLYKRSRKDFENKLKVDPSLGHVEALSEDFIREFQDKVDWISVSYHQKLSEDFIREFQDKVYWPSVSSYQKLSEDFIREFKDKVYWSHVSCYQKLSEDFIREFKDKVNWGFVSCYQKLSEDFIREFKDKVYWSHVSCYQKLSEDFIREFQDKVDWYYVSYEQKLSEDFIREFQDKVDWPSVSHYQKLSAKFRKEFNLTKPDNNWLYKSTKTKLAYIKEHTNYELVDNDTAIIAYKSVRDDGHSVYNFQYHYEIGKTYEAHCDMNIGNENSFGLSSWTLDKAKNYYDKGKIFKVKIMIKDIGAIVHSNQKIRSTKLEIIKLQE